MSDLSPTSSGLGASFVEPLCSAKNLANSLVVEHAPPEIRHLVCEKCWRSVFSADFFQMAWKPKPEFDYSTHRYFSYETSTWRQIQRQRRQHWIKFRRQCQWCKLLCRFIKNRYLFLEKVRQPPKNKKYHLDIKFTQDRWNTVELSLFVEEGWNGVFRIHTAEDDPAAKFFVAREVLSDVDSTMTYKLIQKRVDECANHEHCPPPQSIYFPTRVIDCTVLERPRVFVNQGIEPHDYYVTLSYVWGESQPNCTTTKNLDSYIEGIPLTNIPKTIMDAIMVTHKLGLRYLWVDSFCIMQDSEDDKAREIAQIRRIFRNAYVTIVAACSETVRNGFLHDRRPAVRELIIDEGSLPFHCPDGSIGTMRLRRRRYPPPNREPRPLCPPEPINERAWCLEERVLSPRKLIYATHTLLYECQAIHDNINGAPNFVELCDPEQIPRLPNRIFLPPPAIPGSDYLADHEMAMAWYTMLTLYTPRTLTHSRDRLIALSGVAEQFHRIWLQSRYFAGMWEHQLPGALLWKNSGGEECCSRPDGYRAPSWSWASIDGEVNVLSCGSDGILCSIIHCDVTPVRPINPFGAVKVGGSLVIDTVLQPAVWYPASERESLFTAARAQSDPSKWPDSYYNQGFIGLVHRDAVEPVSEESGCVHVSLGFVRQALNYAYGLVLISATANESCVFRRIGVFESHFRHNPIIEEWLNDRHQRIKIV
ncbi:heterokaryon incompatibility protein-domain-containing protein [Armillaria luteobubalina]|uniref:Heterokaryon incompatibility protein-domain-containing protein n=1 Tax=Armillaria luteobubalina TaxID=153913 RepID=A0AA39Q4E3_9AGAR|nr:heterokaryon incompatibility protein-domain-containing protein [Armillaria luteobubalina]